MTAANFYADLEDGGSLPRPLTTSDLKDVERVITLRLSNGHQEGQRADRMRALVRGTGRLTRTPVFPDDVANPADCLGRPIARAAFPERLLLVVGDLSDVGRRPVASGEQPVRDPRRAANAGARDP